MAESLTVDGVMNALRNCYDPEIPVNIVDLGLVYGVAIDDDSVKVRMTLTTIGCPAHAYLMNQVQKEIEKIPGVKNAEVEIVWEPPWTPDKMSPEAKNANLWEKSNGEKTIDEITTDIATEKNLSPTEIRVQVLESITQLITIGLVHPEESITLPLHT